MSLLQRIDEDIIKALKGGDRDAANTLRGLKSDAKYYQIEKRLEKLSDEDMIGVLSSAAKRRRDSIEQFAAGNREDLVKKETHELEIIKTYLPEPMPVEKLEEIIRAAMSGTGASSPADMGNLMKVIMPQVKGKVDGKLVKDTVLRLLSSQR